MAKTITGTLHYLDSGQLVLDWGAGNFLALKFTNNKPDEVKTIKVGLDPSQGSGLVPLDEDMNGVFKITNKDTQKFVIECYDEDNQKISRDEYDLSGLVCEGAEPQTPTIVCETSSITVAEGSSETVTFTVSNPDGVTFTASATSSDTETATVGTITEESGTYSFDITGVAAGAANVSISLTVDGETVDTHTIATTVEAPVVQPTIVCETTTANAYVNVYDDEYIPTVTFTVSNPDHVAFTASAESSDTGIVYITDFTESSGTYSFKIEGLDAGNATVTIALKDENENVLDSHEIAVTSTDPITITTATVSYINDTPLEVGLGETKSLSSGGTFMISDSLGRNISASVELGFWVDDEGAYGSDFEDASTISHPTGSNIYVVTPKVICTKYDGYETELDLAVLVVLDEMERELKRISLFADGVSSKPLSDASIVLNYTSAATTVTANVQTTIGSFTLSGINTSWSGIDNITYEVDAKVNGTVIDPADYDLTVAFDTVTTPGSVGVIVTCGHYADTTFDFSICGTVYYGSGGSTIQYTDWLNITGIQYIDASLEITQPANKTLNFNEQTSSESLTCVYTPEDAAVSNFSINCATISNLNYSTQPSGDPGEFEVTIQNPLDDDPTLSGSHTCVLGLEINGVRMVDTFTINFSQAPDGKTVTPTDDVQTLLQCAGILDKSYTTINEVLADQTTLAEVIASNNAVDYLVRSTTFASAITADQTAMTDIGANNYAADTLLADNTWLNAICNSAYIDSVLNVSVPTMTSATTPSGEVRRSGVSGSNYEGYKAFDKNTNTGWGAEDYTSIAGWLEYVFPEAIKLKCFKYWTSNDNERCTAFDIKGSNDGTNYTTIWSGARGAGGVWNTVVTSNVSTAYRYFKWETTARTNNLGTFIHELNFYGRKDV